MKRFLALITSFILLTVFLLPLNAFAAVSGAASLSGPGTVRTGDTITLTFSVSGNIQGGSGTLSYDSSRLTLTGFGGLTKDDVNGNKFIFAEASPINGKAFTVTFKVSSSIGAGTALAVGVSDFVASDGTEDASLGVSAYSSTIAAPLSANTNLASLTVGNATISPAFSKNTTSYKASVDFSVTKLNITATPEDAASTVSVSGNALAVGTNSVKVIVKAPSGATKAYTISVTRAQDPNYKASATCSLSGITATGFVLSPNFNPSVKSYVVYLPYETTALTLAGTPADAKSTVKVEGGTNLVVGDNTVKVICTAEDGKTTETYTICVKRAPLWGSKNSTTATTKAATVSTDKDEEKSSTPIWLVILLCVVFAALGFLISFIIYKKKINSLYDYDDDDDNDNDSDDDNNGSSTYNDINYSRGNQGSSNQNNTNRYNSTTSKPVAPVGFNTATTTNTANPPVRTNTATATNPPVRPNANNTTETTNSSNTSNTSNTKSFENNAFYKQYLDSYSNDAEKTSSNDNNVQIEEKEEKKGRFIKNPFEQSADD